ALREAVDAEQRQVIAAVSERLQSLARGDLATRVTTPFPAAYESVREALNRACTDLEELVSQVDASAGSIRTGAAEVRTASDDLARRTEEQASSLERMASTTQRVTNEISATAERSLAARDSTLAARQSASQGSEVVEAAIEAMHLIEKSAQEISQIITIIDGIAFQTNLLALNAGVEAARAGDAGKGFAVVANEVRALAQRSAEAAQTIKDLIQASSRQVEQGVKLVGESGTMLGQIAEQVIAISTTISQVAESAHAQAEDLKSVSSNFTRIDLSTQQNAAMVEENNAAAHHLLAEAERLGELVDRFNTGGARGDFRPARQLGRAA
ncbi:methyl-accepting chemotaxis protein, partial [Novosphingobium sp.]|uniref:methyl-accepting chemotaxis protein n=1 Tax=Novosphingobium sp. TaxID=1874826 RepID=UPI0035B3E735